MQPSIWYSSSFTPQIFSHFANIKHNFSIIQQTQTQNAIKMKKILSKKILYFLHPYKTCTPMKSNDIPLTPIFNAKYICAEKAKSWIIFDSNSIFLLFFSSSKTHLVFLSLNLISQAFKYEWKFNPWKRSITLYIKISRIKLKGAAMIENK